MNMGSCPRQNELVARIEHAFGMRVGGVNCRIVDADGMSQVMRRAGWNRDETSGVVGFHIGREIYVRQDASWSVLHELIHRFGVNADRLNRWVAEGLTEAVARELKRDDHEHRATYPSETAWVQSKLLPKLGMTAVQLGSLLAKSQDPPVVLADLLVRKDRSLDRSKLIAELRPQRPEAPGIGSAICKTCKIGRPPVFHRLGVDPVGDRASVGVGLVLLAGGAAILLPAAIRHFAERG